MFSTVHIFHQLCLRKYLENIQQQLLNTAQMGCLYFSRGFCSIRGVDKIKAPISEKSDKMRGVFGPIFRNEWNAATDAGF